MQPELSIIIVNTNSLDYLKKCMPTVYSGALRDPFEVIVVDNASYDGTDRYLRENYPDAKFVQSRVNLGFTRGNNLGYRHSSGRYLLFLNGDTEVYGDALQRLLDTIRANEKAGIIGARLLNGDGSLQEACVQAFPNVLGEVLDCDLLRRVFPKSRLWGTPAFYDCENGPVRVEVVSGACLMIRRDLFERIGLFDTDYFIFAEDVTLCFKAARAGWDVLYLDEARVLHYGGGSTSRKGQSKFSDVLKRQSLLTFMRKYYGSPYPFLFRAATFANALARLSALQVLLLFRRDTPWWSSGSVAKWNSILRWSLGLEKWAAELNQPCEMTQARWNYVRNLRES